MGRLKFQSPLGMHDILFDDQRYYQKIYELCQEIAKFYGFEKIDTPILEQSELFTKGIGVATDIVRKQMFTLKTLGGDWLTLRPEATAPVVRAYIQHGMASFPQPVKLWYFGPFFRAERPQFGRYRQFWQFGFEIIGHKSPILDAQIIQIFYEILKSLKLKNLIVEINSIGCPECRPHFKRALTSYFRFQQSRLCRDCRRRLKENVLRILDCKEEKCQPVIHQAPQILDYLCESCNQHLKEVLEFCDELGIPYHLNPYLVRGLDYYTKTTFEIKLANEENKKNLALVGGGRYDNLARVLGGKDYAGVGGAGGIERIIILMKERGKKIFPSPPPKIFLAQLGKLAKRKSLKLLLEFKNAKIPVAEYLSSDSLRSQLERANKLGVRYVLILGQKEALNKEIILKDMKTGSQRLIKLDKIVAEMRKRLKEKD